MLHRHVYLSSVLLCALSTVALCADIDPKEEIPASLQALAGMKLLNKANAKGVQIYVAIMNGNKLEWKLQLAMQKLPEKQRLVFNLRYYDEMPYEEMSRILETSEGALKASYHHAAKKIEDYLLNQ